MSQNPQKYEITFSFKHASAFATISVEVIPTGDAAYDETTAVNKAECVLDASVGPTLHHIQLIA